MRLTLEPGGSSSLRDPAALAEALRGWGREPGSFVVLEAPSGRVLQAAGDTAGGFVLECLESDESVLRSQRDDLSRAELLRRLQAFLVCGGAGGADARWRQGRRWISGGEDRPDEPARRGWPHWLRDLLLWMLLPALLLAVGYWGHLRGERYRSQALELEMRVLAHEHRKNGLRYYTRLTLSHVDVQGRETRYLYNAGKNNALRDAKAGMSVQVWQRQDGSGQLRDRPPNGNLAFLAGGVFAIGCFSIWLRGVRQALRERRRPRRPGGLGVDAGG